MGNSIVVLYPDWAFTVLVELRVFIVYLCNQVFYLFWREKVKAIELIGQNCPIFPIIDLVP